LKSLIKDAEEISLEIKLAANPFLHIIKDLPNPDNRAKIPNSNENLTIFSLVIKFSLEVLIFSESASESGINEDV
jgi:hypothetical protein